MTPEPDAHGDAPPPPVLSVLTPAHLCTDPAWDGSTNLVHVVIHPAGYTVEDVAKLFWIVQFEWGMAIHALYAPRWAASVGHDEPMAFISAPGARVEPYVLSAEAKGDQAVAPLTRLRDDVWVASFILRVPEGRSEPLSIVVRALCSVVILAEQSLSLPLRSQGAETGILAGSPLYKRVFVSYARKELWVVELVNSVITALDALQFRYDLKFLTSGDDWETRVREEISTADRFQLFWSLAAKRSKAVQKEWRYAMECGKPGFICPLYWEDTLARPPRELKHLHFAKLDLSKLASRS